MKASVSAERRGALVEASRGFVGWHIVARGLGLSCFLKQDGFFWSFVLPKSLLLSFFMGIFKRSERERERAQHKDSCRAG